MPRVVDHDERRREITYAVWQLAAAGGLGAVTLRAVAAEAGVSVGRIQHYFASEEELVRCGCRALVAAGAEAFRERAAADPVAALRELVTHAVPQTDAQRVGTAVWYAYLTRSAADAEIAAILREAKRGEEAEGVRLLRAAQEAGRAARNLEAGAAVRGLFAKADGLATRVLIGQLGASEAVGMLEHDLNALFSG